MRPAIRQAVVFCVACIATAAGWVSWWPDRTSPVVAPHTATTVAAPKKPTAEAAVRAVELAATDEARLAAADRLKEIPSSAFPGIFDGVTLVGGDRQLTFAAKALLIRWASSDGEAAAGWAWTRLRAEGLWDESLGEIGPAWAWHDPARFGAWALKMAESRKLGATVSMADAMAIDSPVLEFDLLAKIVNWLMPEDPQAAYQVLLRRGGMTTGDDKLADALKTVEQVREALSAFENLDKMQPNIWRNGEMFAQGIFLRWREIDSEDFGRSPYARLLPTSDFQVAAAAAKDWKTLPEVQRGAVAQLLVEEPAGGLRTQKIQAIGGQWAELDFKTAARWLDSLPPQDGEARASVYSKFIAPQHLDAAMESLVNLSPVLHEACFVQAFDAWTKAHPGARPDMTGWSDARREAWSDLEALPASGVVSSGG